MFWVVRKIAILLGEGEFKRNKSIESVSIGIEVFACRKIWYKIIKPWTYWRKQWNCTSEEVKKYDFHTRFNECYANFFIFSQNSRNQIFQANKQQIYPNGILFIRYKKKKNYVIKNEWNCAIEFICGKTFFLYSIFNTFLSERCVKFAWYEWKLLDLI